MGNIVKSYIRRFQTAHRKSHRMAAVLFILACFVVVAVFWQLHATGIAMTNETDCGMEEHTHTEDCYINVLVCGQEESETRTHTEDCYLPQLVCGMEEHTHTIECIIDTTADVETAADWEATLPDLTGVYADDVVAVAESQLGYTESTRNYTLGEDGTTHKGYTRYGEWAENIYGDWDAMFASFCLNYARIDTETFPESSGAYAWIVKLEESGLYATAGDYTPVVGDLIFLDTNDDIEADCVGIVTAIDEETNTLTVIEGDYVETEDATDAVCQVEYAADDLTIVGYGILPTESTETEEEETETAEESVEEETASTEAETEATTSETEVVLQNGSVQLVGAEEVMYETVSSFRLWIYSSTMATSNLGPTSNESTISDVLTYTDKSNETYYLLPIKYFTDRSGSLSNYDFNENDTDYCPFQYAPDANDGKANLTYASYYHIESGSYEGWYVRVQDTGDYGSSNNIRRSNVYYSPKEYKAVLNLGNGNGSSSIMDYTGTTSSSLQYTVDLSSVTKNSDGTVTINLPSNSDLPTDTSSTNNFTVAGDVTVALKKEQCYDYKLVGWYNIATEEYYNVEDGSVEATINFNNDNVFYADWIAESYNYVNGNNSTLLQTENTGDFVTIHMFDYNDLFNLYSASLSQNGLNSETWTDSGVMYETPLLANESSSLAICNEKSFVFFNTDTAKSDGLLQRVANRCAWNYWTGNTTYSGVTIHYPWTGLVGGQYANSSDSGILKKLFNTNAGNTGDDLGVNYMGEGNYLFSYSDSTGMYTFDSQTETAVYNQTYSRFYVYNNSQALGGNTGSFLPYNDCATSWSQADGYVNYWFGMDMEVDFYLPNAVDEYSESGQTNQLTYTSNGNEESRDMVFKFSGDDDIWIFVDDQLVLDNGRRPQYIKRRNQF